MNKKTLTIGLLSAMLAGSMLFAFSASAFWPFDGWSQKGEVKSATTEMIPDPKDRIIQMARLLRMMKTACDQLYGGVQIAKEVQQVVTSDGKVAEIKIESLTGDNVKKMGGNVIEENGSWRDDSGGTREMRSIDAALKARCNQIDSLYTRLLKLYTKMKPTPEPTKRPTVTKKPTPTPSPRTGCYYQEVQCIKAPCEKILVCPTPTKTITPKSERPERPRVQNQRYW